MSSGNTESAILDLPEYLNSWNILKSENLETSSNDQLYLAFTLDRYPIELTFPQWKKKCNIQVQFNLTNSKIDQNSSIIDQPSNILSSLSLTPRIHLPFTNLTNKNLKNRPSSLFHQENSTEIAFEIFQSDYNQVLQFSSIPDEFCSISQCFNITQNRFFYPVPGIYKTTYNNSTNITLTLSYACPNDCLEDQDLGECNIYSWSDQGRVAGCFCKNKRTGLGCEITETSISLFFQLIQVLFLTLSNLSFLTPTIIAFQRKFYSESVVYLLVMLTSTFYHACDQYWTSTTFCILPSYNTLQALDFFTSSVAIWYTCLTIADLSSPFRMFIGIIGTYSAVLMVILNRFSLYVYLIPTILCALIVGVSWKYYQKFPGKKYVVKKLIPGGVFIVIGVICKMVLESDYTYWYMHSLWHVFLGIGLCLVIPDGINKQDKLVLDNDCDLWKVFKRKTDKRSGSVSDGLNLDDIQLENAVNRSTYVSMRDSESETDENIFKIK